MVDQLNLRLLSAFICTSRTGSGIVIVIGLLVLVGWLFDIPALMRVLPGLATMKSNTALAFLLAGLSLWLAHTKREIHWVDLISKGCAIFAVLIGLLTLSQYVFSRDLGIDQLLFKDTLTPDTAFPGRMAPVTALNLSMLGFSLLILDRHRTRWLVEALGIGALLISVLAFIGYAYGVPSLYDFFPYSSIAIHTALTFLILSLGILFARPEQGLMKLLSSDNLGGAIARRLMPTAILVPFVLGWLLLTGQRMGLYDSTFRLVLFAVSTVIVFAILILWNASLLQHADLVRQQSEMELSASRETEIELQKAKLELETANKELEAFSYSVSHDLRSPLRSIDGYSQAVLEDYGELLPVEGRNFLEKVRKSARRMGELIDDLLKLSQVTRAEIRLVPVDLTRLAENILTELQRNYPERRIRFSVAPNLNARGDSRLLQVVLENLLNNAWKYTSKQEDAEIEFGSRQENDQTIFFVYDNGAGFDMAYVDKLFGAFQRLHGMTEFPGTGIGLATVQRIIHRHGGRIWAEGVVNQGATFFFTLPALRGAQPQTSPKETDSIARRAKEII
jgi:signal transduction histidine kinase